MLKMGGVRMKKFFLILTAIYLLILALLGTVLCVTGYMGMNARPETIPANFNPLFLLVIYAPFIGWLLVTGIGLFLKKHWARYSILVMSGFAVFIGVIFCLVFGLMPLPGNPNTNLTIKTVAVGVSIAFLIILPVIYLVFFTRQSVKDLFGTKRPDPGKANRPVGLSVLAIILLISGIFSLLTALFPMYPSLPLCGTILLSGIYLRLYMLIVGIAVLYVAYGFWKLQKAAWITFIIFSCYGIIVGIINLFTFDSEILNTMMPAGYTAGFGFSAVYFKITIAISLVLNLVVLFYVVFKKRVFFKPQSGSEPRLPAEG
jgi:hypothetical protein